MKTNAILLFVSFFVFGKSLLAQECKGFYAFEPDTKVEMTYYDKKGKVTSISEMTIDDITETDGITEAEITSIIKDKKGEEVNTAEFTITCKDDRYEIDVANMMNPAMLKGTYGMEVEIEGDAIIFPNDLSVGQNLEDASTEIKVSSSGLKLMTMTFDITNRKVEAQESVTTPAGTFDCFKVSYELNSKLGFVKKKMKITQWLADGVGVVKEQTFGKKNKIESSSELTKFEKP